MRDRDLIATLLVIIFVVAVTMCSGCTFAMKDGERTVLAQLGGKVSQVSDGGDYAIISEQEKSFRDGVAGIVATTITRAMENFYVNRTQQTERTARDGISAGVRGQQIDADLTRDLAKEETIRLLNE